MTKNELVHLSEISSINDQAICALCILRDSEELKTLTIESSAMQLIINALLNQGELIEKMRGEQ